MMEWAAQGQKVREALNDPRHFISFENLALVGVGASLAEAANLAEAKGVGFVLVGDEFFNSRLLYFGRPETKAEIMDAAASGVHIDVGGMSSLLDLPLLSVDDLVSAGTEVAFEFKKLPKENDHFRVAIVAPSSAVTGGGFLVSSEYGRDEMTAARMAIFTCGNGCEAFTDRPPVCKRHGRPMRSIA